MKASTRQQLGRAAAGAILLGSLALHPAARAQNAVITSTNITAYDGNGLPVPSSIKSITLTISNLMSPSIIKESLSGGCYQGYYTYASGAFSLSLNDGASTTTCSGAGNYNIVLDSSQNVNNVSIIAAFQSGNTQLMANLTFPADGSACSVTNLLGMQGHPVSLADPMNPPTLLCGDNVYTFESDPVQITGLATSTPVQPPPLSIALGGGAVTLSWPTNGAPWNILGSTNLKDWSAVANASITTNGGKVQAMVPQTQGRGFYRLEMGQ